MSPTRMRCMLTCLHALTDSDSVSSVLRAAFTATVTYITYFLTVVPLILHVPKALRFIRHHCCCCLRKRAAPSDKVAD